MTTGARAGLVGVLVAVFLAVSGCNGGDPFPPSDLSTGSSPPGTPLINTPPADQHVVVGQSATFAVVASGPGPLRYQWLKNGNGIPDATESSYTTPTTALTDTGTTYEVEVISPQGLTTTAQATLYVLTVPGPAPIAGDLRFKQVAAASTVNGYFGTQVTTLTGRRQLDWGDYAFPLPLPGSCAEPTATPEPKSCTFTTVFAHAGETLPYQNTQWDAEYFNDFATDLASGFTTAYDAQVFRGQTVLTALDLDPSNDLYIFSSVQANGISGFSLSNQTLSLGAFQAAASQEGSMSHVITAVAWSGNNVLYLSYGWSQDPSTMYEVQVATASAANLPTVAQGLAANGYIITAVGGNLVNGYLLVGTRVAGNNQPRPLVVTTNLLDGVDLANGGYAAVGGYTDSTGTVHFIGER